MITQGYLSRHFRGRHGMADAALLDVALDYALKHLHDQGLFDLGVVLKGGTALRKLRAGNAGRFSTDLDFMALQNQSEPRSLHVDYAGTQPTLRTLRKPRKPMPSP